jgi:hypothetical protein
VTGRILKAFQGVITGEAEDRHGWMTAVGRTTGKETEPELSPAEASTSA